MDSMLTFVQTMLTYIPQFLMAEPICYIMAAVILGFVIDLINDLIKN